MNQPIKPTGSFENPADKAVLAALPQDADERNAFLDGDDTADAPAAATAEAPAPAAVAPAPAAEAAEAEVAAALKNAPADELDDDLAGAPPAAPVEAAAPAQAAQAAQAAASAAPPAEAPAAPAAEATPAAAPVPQPAPAPLPYKTRTPAEIQAERDRLMAEKAEAFEKYSDGSLTPKEYMAIDAKVSDGITGLASELALMQANQQQAINSAQQAIHAVKVLAKTQGTVDYDADEEARTLFNATAEALEKVPSFAALDNDTFYARVHQQVLALRGVAPTAAPTPAPAPAATAAPAAPAAARAMPEPPLTLRGVPAASTSNTNGGLNEELGRLSGLDFERRIAQLPREQRDAWMDS